MRPEADVVIRVDGLWKQYGVPLAHRLRRLAARWSGGEMDPAAAVPWSLRDVSSYLIFVACYDAIILVLGLLFFPYVVEE